MIIYWQQNANNWANQDETSSASIKTELTIGIVKVTRLLMWIWWASWCIMYNVWCDITLSPPSLGHTNRLFVAAGLCGTKAGSAHVFPSQANIFHEKTVQAFAWVNIEKKNLKRLSHFYNRNIFEWSATILLLKKLQRSHCFDRKDLYVDNVGHMMSIPQPLHQSFLEAFLSARHCQRNLRSKGLGGICFEQKRNLGFQLLVLFEIGAPLILTTHE